jgi:hypothetical protein
MAFSDVLPTRKEIEDKLIRERNELIEAAARRFLRTVMGEDLFDAPQVGEVDTNSSRVGNPRKRATDIVTHNAGNQLDLPFKGKKRVATSAKRSKGRS